MNLVHIGLPKAASTTLQNTVFVEQQQFLYLGPFGHMSNNVFSDRRVEELDMCISFQDSLEYDPVRTKSLVGELHQGSRPFLVSSESFSTEGRADRRLIADRLYELFAPAKILIILRAQPSLCQSMYLNYLRASGQRTVSFDNWVEVNYGRIALQSRVGLDYERLVRTYEDIFGPENVVVLPFELINDENSIFAATLAELLHMPLSAVQESLRRNVANPRMSQRHLLAVYIQDYLPKGTNLALLGRRWMPRSLYEWVRRFVVGGRRVDSPDLPENWSTRIFELCAHGNTKLAERKNLPLRALGYPVIGERR
jgi:hypothetical protein